MAITRWIRGATLVALLSGAASGVALVARAHPSPPPEPPPALAEAPARTPEDDRPALLGTVVDEAGQGVAGAEVGGTVWNKPVHATTGADGTFRIEPPSDAKDADRPSGLIQASQGGRIGLGPVGRRVERRPVRVVLREARDLAVTVRDGQDRPVAGAEVVVLEAMLPIATGRTDATGRWSGRLAAETRSWAVLARRGGLGMDYATARRPHGSRSLMDPLPADLALKLDGADPIRLRFVDPDGRPLVGVAVTPWYVQKPDHPSDINLGGLVEGGAMSGPDGTALLDWLPARPVGRHAVFTRLAGYTIPDNATYIEPGPPGGAVTITMRPLERLAGVVREADGRPAGGVAVELRGVGVGQHEARESARTDAAGRFEAMVDPDQAYVVLATRGDQAAPYRSGIVVRAGRPVDGVELILARATVVAGRVTVGPAGIPAADVTVILKTMPTPFPEGLVPPGDNIHRDVTARQLASTDASGRYEFRIGPGEYQVEGPARVEPTRVSVPPAGAPTSITVDRRMPWPELGPLALLVVDAEGRPLAGATVSGEYASPHASRGFERLAVGADGTARTERLLDPIVLRALSPDGKLGGVVRSEAEATEARIAVTPTVAAEGRLLDPSRRPLAGRELTYAVRIPKGPSGGWTDAYGGTVATDDAGRFRLADLVAGQRYHVELPLDVGRALRTSREVTNFVAESPGPVDLGELTGDPSPIRP